MRAWTLMLVALALALPGCASRDLDEYQPPPDMDVEREGPPFPQGGISLADTLDGIYASRESDNRILIHKIAIVQTNVSPWKSLEADEARSIAASDKQASFGIIANRTCTSRVDMVRGGGQHVDWFLLPRGRLAAFDHMQFHWMCSANIAYQPAVFQQIEVERKLLQLADDKFPKSQMRVAMIYTRGMSLAWAGRVEDAEKMLKLGDEALDLTTYNKSVRRQGSAGANISRKSNREAQRKSLVRAIQDAKNLESTQVDTVPTYRRTPSRQEAGPSDGQRDRARWERYEREQAERRFVADSGSFRLVDKTERRRGPREGAVWLTYEEMQRVRADRQEELSRASAKAPQPEAMPEPLDLSGEIEPPLFVEINGEWTEVDAVARERGPNEGEVWLDYNEMQMILIERALDAAEE